MTQATRLRYQCPSEKYVAGLPAQQAFDPPMLGSVEGPLRLQKSPHNVVTTFRAIFIRQLSEEDERGCHYFVSAGLLLYGSGGAVTSASVVASMM